MLNRQRNVFLLAVAVLHLTFAPASAQDAAGQIDRYLAAEVEKRGIPGLTVAVVRGGHGAPPEVLVNGVADLLVPR